MAGRCRHQDELVSRSDVEKGWEGQHVGAEARLLLMSYDAHIFDRGRTPRWPS